MAVKVKLKGTFSTVAEVLKHQKKQLGDSIGSYGGLPVQMDRIPTGLLELDLSTGGGLVRGKCNILWGPESSCKTNVALLAIANNQRLHPEETNVFIAIEPFDGNWAKKLGVDIDKLVVLYPSFAEEVIDMCEQLLFTEDCGIIVIDSLAAMITTQEAEKTAIDAIVGTQGLVIGKLCRRTTWAHREAEKAGRCPTLIYINQHRYKIGVMMGDPSEMPGGQAPRHQAALWLRFYGKDVLDSKVSDNYPIAKEVSFSIKKHKVTIVSKTGMFKMITLPHDGFKIGESNDLNTISTYLEKFGFYEKDAKKGWLILDELYPTQKAFEDRFKKDRVFAAGIREAVIGRVLSDHEELLAPEDDEADNIEITPDGEVIEKKK